MSLLPECLDDYVGEDNPVRVVEAFIDALDLHKLNLISQSTVVIDGSKFKGVNNRDRNYTPGKLKRRREELERSVERYFYRLDKMDQKAPEVVEIQAPVLKEKIASLKEALVELDAMRERLDRHPEMMRVRRDTVEWVQSTL